MARPTLRWSVAAGSTLTIATRSRLYAGLGDRCASTTPRHARKQSTVTPAPGRINHVDNGGHRTTLVITIVRYSPVSVAPQLHDHDRLHPPLLLQNYEHGLPHSRQRPISPPAHRTISATLLP